MALRDLDERIKTIYKTKEESVPDELLIPLLRESILYKRAVGFFSSTSLLELSAGIGALVRNGGKIQLIASPRLSEEDVEAISRGYCDRERIIKESLVAALPQIEELNVDEQNRFNLLANLISSRVLDIRIALIDDDEKIGIFHDKLAVLTDAVGEKVAFSGSMNETKTALVYNYESIDVFRSWRDPENRIELKEQTLDAIWDNREPGLETFNFPEVKELIVDKYLMAPPNYDLDKDKDSFVAASELAKTATSRCGIVKIPTKDKNNEKPFNIYDYQAEAVRTWAENGHCGLFDMATGTGKTITALVALASLYGDRQGNLFVFVVCPYQHLVEQWVEDLDWFGIKPIIAYGDSKQRDWKKRLREAVLDNKLGLDDARFICCICTNATFASDFVQDQITKIGHSALLVADEAHNLGSEQYRKQLSEKFEFRLALSATFDRHHDEEGTQILRDYFGETCIRYPIEKAIKEGKLSEYKYFPVPVVLTDKELEEYKMLSREIGKSMKKGKNDRTSLSQYGKMIALQRARLVAAASNKLPLLKKLITPYVNDEHILIYCGAAQELEQDQDSTAACEEDKRQITHVVDILGNDLKMRVSKFTSEEPIEERQILKGEFSNGNLQALVAIKCLDEGVNIPNIQTAFMLSSTTNPKEYIQRRGRLLRKAPGKDFAVIFDFITLPYTTGRATGQTLEENGRVYSLVHNEMERAFEFAQYAINFSDAQITLDEIRESYRLDELKFASKRMEG